MPYTVYNYIQSVIISILNFVTNFYNINQVGAKSRNIAYLKGRVPSFVGIPTSVALPFGVFEKVLSDELNQVFYLSITYILLVHLAFLKVTLHLCKHQNIV